MSTGYIKQEDEEENQFEMCIQLHTAVATAAAREEEETRARRTSERSEI